MRRLALLTAAWLALAGGGLMAADPSGSSQPQADINALVLAAIRSMPAAGGYDTKPATTAKLGEAIRLAPAGALEFEPGRAMPSYCSSATYLVFLKSVQMLRERGRFDPTRPELESLIPRDDPNRPDRKPGEWGPRDGEGVWGRWNANGPGTARLFHELKLGRNFEDFATARPGDFLKIWWNDQIGAKERGHSVVYLGLVKRDGVEYVRFWSSNQGAGYGEKEVPRTDVKRALFSRFESPAGLARAKSLPPTDAYLYGLIDGASTPAEMKSKCGIR